MLQHCPLLEQTCLTCNYKSTSTVAPLNSKGIHSLTRIPKQLLQLCSKSFRSLIKEAQKTCLVLEGKQQTKECSSRN